MNEFEMLNKLPVYKDTGQPFIPGRDPCFVVYGEVVWADGAFGLAEYRVKDITPVWNKIANRWGASNLETTDRYFIPRFYSTDDAAQAFRNTFEDMKKVS